VKYAYKDATGWNLEIVDGEGWEMGQYTSLALDASGFPHISYYDGEPDDLKYAYKDGSGWHIETVDSEGLVGKYTSLALNASGYAYITYYADYDYSDDSNDELKYAYKDEMGWQTAVIDSGGMVGLYTSLVVEMGSGYSHISHCLVRKTTYQSPRALKYAYQDAFGWHGETVDSEASIGSYTSLALDASAYPHISYFKEYRHEALRYAYKDGTGWYVEVVDGDENVRGHTSLALDGADLPHICYCKIWESGSGYLNYAYKDGTGWHTEMVDDFGDVGEYNCLVLDGAGFPHVSYYRDRADFLEYAYKDGTGWHVEIVDNDGDVGEYTSLALSAASFPHISYYDESNRDLKYAHKDEMGWHVQIVESEGWVGEYTSLALDSSGFPRISYFDAGGRDLKYAYVLPEGDIGLLCELEGGILNLTWTAAWNVDSYLVYGMAEEPWVLPDLSPPTYVNRIAIIPGGTTTWSSGVGVGDPAGNWTYLVIAMDNSQQELERSNRVGEHDFDGEVP